MEKVKAMLPIAIVLAIALESAGASKDELSKEFRVTQPQVLSGVLTDPSQARIAGFGLELLSKKKVVIATKTNDLGEYSFGEMPAGKYRIRVNPNFGFHAPRVKCSRSSCSIEPVLYVIDWSYKNCKGPCL